ncbi:netrin-4-like [Ptychodera flava]|uniref:netrin-4-like n=1 Tax=Ptychodera flava TaxID=63121 RepID=UPI00396A2303
MFGLRIFFMLQLLWCLAEASPAFVDPRPGCATQTCHPRPGNLVVGREVTALQCGLQKGEKYCAVDDCSNIECIKCNARKENKAHPASHMIDSFLSHPDTWWQSPLGGAPEAIQLDLEGRFYFTHLVMVFKSSRPAAMVIERSDDFGRSWRPYAYYAANCTEEFGLAEDEVTDGGAVCTSRYSDPEPCTRGEVIFRSLLPTRGRVDPYSAETQDRMKITNLRITLMKSQQCPCVLKNPTLAAELPKLNYFAVYDMIVGGTCFCNGHANECVPIEDEKDTPENKVHGKCVCQHNTDGENCERCLPMYNDAPWRPANALTNEPNACAVCECNGHADSCHFDPEVWSQSRQVSGGVCDDCKHNTRGRQCEKCKPGYYRSTSKDLTDPEVCIMCQCSAIGSTDQPCDPDTAACSCKPGVAGPFCDRCSQGFYGFGVNGCRRCSCAEGAQCDQNSGVCIPPIIEWTVQNEAKKRRKERKNKEKRRRQNQFRLAKGLSKFQNCICLHKSVIDTNEDLCQFDYVIRAKILRAEDTGSSVVVTANAKRVFRKTEADTVEGGMKLYPTSWIKTGCTCPALLPGEDYIIAGNRDASTGRHLVDQNSIVTPWERDVGRLATSLIGRRCS